MKRIYGLDIFRAIAIVIVVHFHGAFMLKGTFLEGFPWFKVIDGVELFFVLSGFLIGKIILKILDVNNFTLNTAKILTFWNRRWLRTLPNYYLFLIINLILVNFKIIGGSIDDFNYKFLFFLQNFNSPFTGFFWESWSLSIEEWFYLILPITLFFTLKWFPSKKGVLIALFTLLAFPLILRLIDSGDYIDAYTWQLRLRKVVTKRLDVIIYGVIAAYIKLYFPVYWKKYALHSLIIGILLISIITYIPRNYNSFMMKTFYFNFIALGIALLLPFFSSIKNYKNYIGKVVTKISIYSYSMYLINLVLVQIISTNFPVKNPSDGFLKYIIYWILVIVLSFIVYTFFEKPILNLRKNNN